MLGHIALPSIIPSCILTLPPTQGLRCLPSSWGSIHSPSLSSEQEVRCCEEEPHLHSFGAMDALRHADARVQAATHPRGTARWRLNRYNPLARLRWKKNRVAHPVAHQKARTRARLNYINPLFYLRRIKRNLTGMGRRRHGTVL